MSDMMLVDKGHPDQHKFVIVSVYDLKLVASFMSGWKPNTAEAINGTHDLIKPLLENDVGDVLAVLKRVEENTFRCIFCGKAPSMQGHAPDCALHALIKTLEGKS